MTSVSKRRAGSTERRFPNIKKYTDEMVIETEIDVGTTMRLKVYTQNQPSA